MLMLLLLASYLLAARHAQLKPLMAAAHSMAAGAAQDWSLPKGIPGRRRIPARLRLRHIAFWPLHPAANEAERPRPHLDFVTSPA